MRPFGTLADFGDLVDSTLSFSTMVNAALANLLVKSSLISTSGPFADSESANNFGQFQLFVESPIRPGGSVLLRHFCGFQRKPFC